ncbi:MAG: hypothetical protein IKJ77_05520 [Firmicutes bacterium]|nr:hypothetical protein [Bacillota bacterium]
MSSFFHFFSKFFHKIYKSRPFLRTKNPKFRTSFHFSAKTVQKPCGNTIAFRHVFCFNIR